MQSPSGILPWQSGSLGIVIEEMYGPVTLAVPSENEKMLQIDEFEASLNDMVNSRLESLIRELDADELERHVALSQNRGFVWRQQFRRALINWNRLLRMDKMDALRLFSLMSSAQFSSYRLLLEWRDECVKRSLPSDGHLGFPLRLDVNGLLGPCLDDLHSPLHTAPLKSLSKDLTAYSKRISMLWEWEFFYDLDKPRDSSFLESLKTCRVEAAEVAACHRVSYAYYDFQVKCKAHLPLQRPPIDTQVRDTRGLGTKSTLDNDEALVLGQTSSKMHYFHPQSATIAACPWLMSPTYRPGLPCYLWDVTNERTVLVKKLSERPQYTAISHTWGRWRRGPSIAVEGCLWKVPQNTKFKVQDLPQRLSSAFAEKTKYLWIDLLCIPQDGSNLGSMEIARQASIFKSASRVVAWLNEMTDWRGLEVATNWLCLHFLERTGIREAGLTNVSKIVADASNRTPTRLLSYSQTSGDEEIVLNPWFTSLWTLQEACLRPDLLLCDRDFNIFTVGNHYAVPLDELIALLPKSYSGLPKGVHEITLLFDKAEMLDLNDLTRHGILIMGNQRFCSERRAEAIMSALGFTEWYESFTPPSSREQTLVLGKYPYEFLHEARRKLGSATFFDSIVSTDRPVFDDLTRDLSFVEDQGYMGKVLPQGSMLPVGPEPRFSPFSMDTMMFRCENDSLRCWEIEPTGSVRVRKVALTLPTHDTTVTDSTWRICAPSLDGTYPQLLQENADLHEWVKHYRPETANYAICTFSNEEYPSSMGGILLKEVRPGILIKIGSYYRFEANTSERLEICDVDWLVL